MTSLLACFGVCDALKGVWVLEAVTFMGVCTEKPWAEEPCNSVSIAYENADLGGTAPTGALLMAWRHALVNPGGMEQADVLQQLWQLEALTGGPL